jgi:proton-dependent oligopeptide transporter, POT family
VTSTSTLAPEASAPPPVPFTRFEQLTGHPPGLFVLFFTEMWERFSYYGMRTLLMLYMLRYLLKPERAASVWGHTQLFRAFASVFSWFSSSEPTVDAYASQMYGVYTALVYLTPLFGGLLADKILGKRRTVYVGGVLMAIGHFLMASEQLFYVALFFLILGNGAFKPNISTQVGDLYRDGDSRRDRAFSIFYVGINLGALLSGVIVGTLAQTYGAQLSENPEDLNPAFDALHPGRGWHYGFGAAGVGMVIGLVLYVFGQRYLAAESLPSKLRTVETLAPGPDAGYRGSPTVTRTKVAPVPLTPAELRAVWALVGLCALNIVFWAVYEQQGNTMQLWATDRTHWPSIGSFKIPSTWFQSFNPFMIFALTPVITIVWAWQQRRGREPSSVAKMAIGCIVLGASFLIMVVGAGAVGLTGKGSLGWPLGCTAMLTVGELYLSPIGMSLVTKVAPKRIVSMMMGMWLLSSFFGNYASGLLGMMYRATGDNRAFFAVLALLGVLAGLAIWAFNRPLKRALGRPDL